MTEDEDMNSIDQVYGNNELLKAADLGGREIAVVISGTAVKHFENETKLTLSFEGKRKVLVLNKTNAKRIAADYGPMHRSWVGKQIILYPDRVDFKGDLVDAIRVKVPPRKPITEPAPRHAVTDRGGYATHERVRSDDSQDGLSDDIPF